MMEIETETDPLSADSDSAKIALITGAGGLLGGAMRKLLPALGWRVAAMTRADLDVSNEEAVREAVSLVKPDVVINCASTTDVDRCEREPEGCFAVNEKGPRFLARACRESGADMVHVSTDYVFDGSKEGFYTQEDEPNPQSVYAKSKLAGELAVREETRQFYIIRTSWIFGAGGKNFGSRVIEFARKGAHLKGVTDQTSIPTYRSDLASRIAEIINLKEYGLYHVTNSGVTTWYDFARLALDLAELNHIELEPVTRAELYHAASRPKNSAMRCLASEKSGLSPLRHWREALTEFVHEIEDD